MKRNFFGWIVTSISIMIAIISMSINVSAGTYVSGSYSYTVSNGEAKITDVKMWSLSGSVQIPSFIGGYPVTSIGDNAFYECSAITSVQIPNGVVNIGDYAFGYCNSLESIEIPDSVTSIGNNAFRNCSSLTTINMTNSVTNIGDNAFYGCSSLTEITIPDNITSIGSALFSGCSALMKIYIPNRVTSIDEYAFYGCSSLTEITIPDSVTSIGSAAFCGCQKLTTINIPNGVTSIEDNVFNGCYKLRSIELPNSIITIGDYAFFLCAKLTSINIPSSVTSIGNSALSGCGSLTEITIPDSVTSIGSSAFNQCFGITSIDIPDNVTTIGDYTFYNCRGLTNIEIPNGVVSIGGYAFYGCSNLTSINIPSTVTNIGDYAFYNCGDTTKINVYLTLKDSVDWAGVCNVSEIVFYGDWKITYIGDLMYEDVVLDGGSVSLPQCEEFGNYYVFDANGKIWTGENITEDVIVTVTKHKCVYEVQYIGDYTGSEMVEYQSNVTLPVCDEYGYHYTFTVDGKAWTGENIIEDITVTVTKHKRVYEVQYIGDYTDSEMVEYQSNVTLPVCDNYGYYYTFTVNGEVWTGENITEDITVTVAKNKHIYEIQYIGDYTVRDMAEYQESVILPTCDEYGYYYVFTVNGEVWAGENITEDIIVTVTKHKCVYEVRYIGDYTDNINVEYQESVILPTCDEYGYYYTFTANGKTWMGENIMRDTVVTVAKSKCVYEVTYTGDYTDSCTVEYQSNVTLPTAPYGYHYTFTVDGEVWAGENITEDVTVTVIKNKNVYVVTYTGDYEGVQSIEYLDGATLPVAPEGYVYKFTVNGSEWNGTSITKDVTVSVTMYYDLCKIESFKGIDDLIFNDTDATGITYNRCIYSKNISVSEGALVAIYENEACDKEIDTINIAKDAKAKFFVKITAESGRSVMYTFNIERKIVETLGDIEFVSSVGGYVTLKLKTAILGLPEISFMYSNNGVDWNEIEAIYDFETCLVQATGLSENTHYWVKVKADYGDTAAESSAIEIMTTQTVSSECDVIQMLAPVNAEIDSENNTIYARVANAFEEYKIDAVVSDGATWALYRTSSATVPVENNTLTLRVGKETTAYIKVVAEDGYTQKSYKVTIYRQKKSEVPEVTISNGMVNISAPEGSIILYTTNNENPIPGVVGNVYTEPFEAIDGTVLKATALNPDCEEYSDIVICHVKLDYTTAIEQLYLDDMGDSVEWCYYITTDNPDGINGTLVVAVYNSDNTLIGIERKVITTSAKETEVNGMIECENANNCKVFLWSNTGGMIPLCECVEATPVR